VGRLPHRLTIALVVALAVGGCGHASRAKPTTSSSSVTVPTVRYDRVTGSNHDIPLPQVSGMNDAAAQQRVDDAIRATMTKVASDFEADLAGGPGRLTEVSKETTLATARVVSVKVVLDADTGGAHGMPIVATFVADLRRGRLLTTAVLFPPGSNWLAFLSEQSLAQLAAAEGYEVDAARTGTAPKPENFAHAALTPDALTITFDAYQVGPFAAGTPTVTFTRDSLAAAGLSGVIDGFFGRPTQGTARSAEEP